MPLFDEILIADTAISWYFQLSTLRKLAITISRKPDYATTKG